MLKRFLALGACLCVTMALPACGHIPTASSSDIASVSETVSAAEFDPAESGSVTDEPGINAKVTIPISYGGEGWETQEIGWIDGTKLLAVFEYQDRLRDRSDITEKSVVVYDMADRTERLVCTFRDKGWVGDIRADDNEVLITSSEKLYSLPQADLTQITVSPYKGDDWRCNTFGGLYAGRDELGMVIRSGAGETIRVATKTEAYFFDGPQWSPDGCYLLYNKYSGGVGHPVNKCIADREGRAVCEFAFPETDNNTYWSNDSRYIVAQVLDHPEGLLRLLDVEAGREIAASPLPYVEHFRSILDVHKSTTVCWRQEGKRQPGIVYTFDVLTGQKTDIVTLPQPCNVKFSPDGRMLAMLEWENATEVRFFESGIK